MARTPPAPINPAILQWAMGEGGETPRSLAARVNVKPEVVEKWLIGDAKPTAVQLRKLAKVLKRPSALFYLPQPPSRGALPTRLRRAPGPDGRPLTPKEIGEIRWARRVQEGTSWLLERMPEEAAEPLPLASLTTSPSEAAASARAWVGVRVREQLEWEDAAFAYKAWRAVLTDKGLLVFQFELGRDGIRGFSASDPRAPLIAVNSAYRPEVRIYSLFHELGHLLLGEGSACLSFVDPGEEGGASSDAERWCERFSAAFLLPADEFRSAAREVGLVPTSPDAAAYEHIRRLARRFKVSLRAAAIRAGELGVRAGLMDVVEDRAGPILDYPKPSSSSGGGVPSAEKRLRFFGRRVPDLLIDGVDRGLLTERDAGDYLHLAPSAYSELEFMVRTGAEAVEA